jgi:hypothetical protein
MVFAGFFADIWNVNAFMMASPHRSEPPIFLEPEIECLPHYLSEPLVLV